MKKKIIEITTLEELMEMSAVSAVAGYAGPPVPRDKDLEEGGGGSGGVMRNSDFYRGKDMRQELQTEMLMRQYIRGKINEQVSEEKRKQRLEEQQLRLVIRGLIKEAKEAANPHPNTGINKLRDAFRKGKPTLKSKYQQLTTSQEQRDTFSAHMLRAFVRLFDELDALQAKGEVDNEVGDIEAAVGEAPTLGLEAPPENQEADDIEKELEDLMEAILSEVKIEIDDEMDIVSDDEKAEEKAEEERNKSQAEKDFQKKKEADKEKEEFGSGMEGDATGRNQAYDTFRLVQTYFSDAYLDLSNEEDQKMFRDWCLYNMKLLFQNFEESLPTSPESPEIADPEGV
jgi:hypothetical protein